MTSLRKKISMGLYAFAAGVIALAALAYTDLQLLADRIARGEAISSFLDITLELRRYEKNLFLYQQPQDYLLAQAFVKHADQLAESGQTVLSTVAHAGELPLMRQLIEQYEQALERYHQSRDEATARDIRTAGHDIVQLAERWNRTERSHLAVSSQRSANMLLAGLAAIALLGLILTRYIVRSVSIPLSRLEQELQSVGHGQHERIEPCTQDREIVSVAEAVNRMLDLLATKQRHLAQSEKLAALGTLAAGIAHELNNPLSNISTSNQLAQEDLERCDQQSLRRWCAQIDAETLRAQRIVRSLLDFSRDRAFQCETLPLADVFTRALASLQPAAREHIHLELDVPPDLTVLGDQDALRQVLINLMQNSLDARPQGVAIRAQARRMSGAEALATCENCQFARPPERKLSAMDVVRIRFEDDGPGIATESLQRIFDPFFTTRDVGHGSGLGLYIAQDILHRHEGVIGASAGQGARFVLILPAPIRGGST